MLDANFFISLLSLSLVKATPLVLGAMAGILCERTGIINIGIEGMMLMSAFTGFLGAAYSSRDPLEIVLGSTTITIGGLWVGVTVGIITGALMGLFLAVLSIKYKVDQIIGGTVINLLAFGITSYFAVLLIDQADVSGIGVLPIIKVPLLNKIPIIGPILFENQPITFTMLILVGVLHVALFYTPWGLRTRSVGEHPRAADTVGIRVNRMRYLNTMLGGMMAGLAGAFISLEAVGSFEKGGMTNGRGFIALAVMISGNWRPINALAIALLFGASDALGVRLQLGGLNQATTLMIVAGLGLLIVGGLWFLVRIMRERGSAPYARVMVGGMVLMLIVSRLGAAVDLEQLLFWAVFWAMIGIAITPIVYIRKGRSPHAGILDGAVLGALGAVLLPEMGKIIFATGGVLTFEDTFIAGTLGGLLSLGALWRFSPPQETDTPPSPEAWPYVQFITALVGLALIIIPSIADIPETKIPFQFLGLPPYILTIVIVAGLVGNVRPPAAEGKVYEKQ